MIFHFGCKTRGNAARFSLKSKNAGHSTYNEVLQSGGSAACFALYDVFNNRFQVLYKQGGVLSGFRLQHLIYKFCETEKGKSCPFFSMFFVTFNFTHIALQTGACLQGQTFKFYFISPGIPFFRSTFGFQTFRGLSFDFQTLRYQQGGYSIRFSRIHFPAFDKNVINKGKIAGFSGNCSFRAANTGQTRLFLCISILQMSRHKQGNDLRRAF